MSRYASSTASVALGSALAAVAFGAQGGSQLSRTTLVELALILASGALVAVGLMRGRDGRFDGGLTLAAFGALAALTGLSVLWSIVPDQSWIEAGRTFSYLAVFAAALACARLVPDGYVVVLRGILLAAFVITAYALASRIWPATLASDEIYARLGQPYGYWNALGATAAVAVPPALWLATRRSGRAASNALAYPLLSLLVVTMFLSYSRGALIFAGIGALAWLAIVPLRLRTLAVLAVSIGGAAPMVLWTLAKDAFTKSQVPLSVRESVSTQFGLFVLATVVVVLAVSLVIHFRVARRPPATRVRLIAGIAAALVATAVPVALFAALVASDRGLTGTISADYESLTSARGSTPGGASRLTTASNSRGRYWHQAREVFVHHQLAGTGAGTYGVARLRYRRDDLVAMHAHGYVMQTLADFGIVGALVTGALLLAWLVAAIRSTAVSLRPRRRLPYGADRVALVALALTAIVYGMHSAIEWLWFVPGPTVMALVAAGFVAGRGPLRRWLPRPGTAPARAPVAPPPPAPSGPIRVPSPVTFAQPPRLAVAAALGTGFDPGAQTEVLPSLHRRMLTRAGARLRVARRPLRHVPRPLLALTALIAGLVGAWMTWQPLRSDNTSNHALQLSAKHRYAAALRAAGDAHRYDPLTPKPLVVRASIEDSEGKRVAALHDLERAVIEFRGDPQVWLQLAEYQLATLNRPADAVRTLRGELYLDPESPEAQQDFFLANARLSSPQGAGAPAPLPRGVPAPSGGPANG